MKPDKITCNNCGKQINKGKWCSDKCRMDFKRKANKVEQEPEQKQPEQAQKPEQTVPEQKPEHVRPKLTRCDGTFYDRALKDFGEPYYNFDGELREIKCGWCGDKFKTKLALNRYCSYDHYKQALSTLVK